jgi:hypothetical protein
MDFSVTAWDVANFLKEYNVESSHVAMGKNPDGRPNGQCVVGFSSVEMAEDCMVVKNKQKIGLRFVDIYRSSEQNWIAAAYPQPGNNFGNEAPAQVTAPTIRLRGCPLAAQPSDVAGFLSNYSIPVDNVVMGRGMDGGPNGDSYVRLPTDMVAQQIVSECNGADVQGVAIEVTKSDYSLWCMAKEGKCIVDKSQMNSGFGGCDKGFGKQQAIGDKGYDKGCGKQSDTGYGGHDTGCGGYDKGCGGKGYDKGCGGYGGYDGSWDKGFDKGYGKAMDGKGGYSGGAGPYGW